MDLIDRLHQRLCGQVLGHFVETREEISRNTPRDYRRKPLQRSVVLQPDCRVGTGCKPTGPTYSSHSQKCQTSPCYALDVCVCALRLRFKMMVLLLRAEVRDGTGCAVRWAWVGC